MTRLTPEQSRTAAFLEWYGRWLKETTPATGMTYTEIGFNAGYDAALSTLAEQAAAAREQGVRAGLESAAEVLDSHQFDVFSAEVRALDPASISAQGGE